MMVQEHGQQELNCSDLLYRLGRWVGGGIGSWVDRRDERMDGRTDGWVGRSVDDMKKSIIIFVVY